MHKHAHNNNILVIYREFVLFITLSKLEILVSLIVIRFSLNSLSMKMVISQMFPKIF